jgi:hypothetical protein
MSRRDLGFKGRPKRPSRPSTGASSMSAMTRAEDELYVTGYLTKQGKVEGSWYEAIEQGLAPLSEV